MQALRFLILKSVFDFGRRKYKNREPAENHMLAHMEGWEGEMHVG